MDEAMRGGQMPPGRTVDPLTLAEMAIRMGPTSGCSTETFRENFAAIREAVEGLRPAGASNAAAIGALREAAGFSEGEPAPSTQALAGRIRFGRRAAEFRAALVEMIGADACTPAGMEAAIQAVVSDGLLARKPVDGRDLWERFEAAEAILARVHEAAGYGTAEPAMPGDAVDDLIERIRGWKRAADATVADPGGEDPAAGPPACIGSIYRAAGVSALASLKDLVAAVAHGRQAAGLRGDLVFEMQRAGLEPSADAVDARIRRIFAAGLAAERSPAAPPAPEPPADVPVVVRPRLVRVRQCLEAYGDKFPPDSIVVEEAGPAPPGVASVRRGADSDFLAPDDFEPVPDHVVALWGVDVPLRFEGPWPEAAAVDPRFPHHAGTYFRLIGAAHGGISSPNRVFRYLGRHGESAPWFFPAADPECGAAIMAALANPSPDGNPLRGTDLEYLCRRVRYANPAAVARIPAAAVLGWNGRTPTLAVANRGGDLNYRFA